jgi:hypothetical protein
MIEAEFNIVNKKDGIKRLSYTEDMATLQVGSLLDVEFSEEGLIWECRVDEITHASNGKNRVMVFKVTGIAIVTVR